MEVGTSKLYTAVPSMPIVRHSTCTWETQSIFRFYPVGIKGKNVFSYICASIARLFLRRVLNQVFIVFLPCLYLNRGLCFICLPPYITVSRRCWIEARTVATLTLVVRRSRLHLIHIRIDLIRNSPRSYPQLGEILSTILLDLIHNLSRSYPQLG
jgi:hypothetical protein